MKAVELFLNVVFVGCMGHLGSYVVALPYRKICALWSPCCSEDDEDATPSEVTALVAKEDKLAPILPTSAQKKVNDVNSTCLVAWCLMAFANASVIFSIALSWDAPRLARRMWPLDPAVAWLVPLFCGFMFLIRVFQYWYKYFLYCTVLGMTTEDFDLSNQERMEWSGDEIALLEEKYGERKIKIADSTVRRTTHIITNAGRAFFYNTVLYNHPVGAFEVSVVLWVLSSGWHMFFERRSNIVSKATFIMARVRDGRLGRLNFVSVQVWQYAGAVVTILVLIWQISDVKRAGFFFALAMQPVIWGDAFAEIVGAYFGRCSFPVYGIGEVNRKTVEGCIAAFTANLIPLWIMLSNPPVEVNWNLPVWGVALMIAFVGMVAETVAVRSTDNAVMMLASAVALLCCESAIPKK